MTAPPELVVGLVVGVPIEGATVVEGVVVEVVLLVVVVVVPA